MIYHNIVFIQGEEYNQLFAISLNEYDVANNREEARIILRYLQQWDYGSESEHSPLDEEPWGSSDKIHKFVEGKHTYVVSINTQCEYIGLCRY
tara:strand:+ start:511 stop:789 length:279 start_codon:yes stop_codon:yes gene_type:complete